jgi:hypothetical protein
MLGLAVIFVLAGGWALGGRALGQEGQPEIVPRRTRPLTNGVKRGNEPRAVGILQLNGDGKGSLIPVAILVNGKFFDASAYKADPVPMALERGTVYEAEPDGDSQGLFTVNAALHNTGTGSAHLWVGTGSYLPNGAVAAKGTHKAENAPVGIDSGGDEGPPRLKRPEGNTEGDAAKPAPASQTTAPTGQGSATDKGTQQQGASTKADSGKNAAQGSGSPGAAGQASANQTSPSQASPNQTSQKPASSDGSTKGQVPDQTSGNYYRPTLRRGKPTEAAPEEIEDRADKTLKSASTAGATSPGTGDAKTAEPIRLMAAISDAAGPEAESYKFFWKRGEEEERQNQMLALAGDQVRAYAAALLKNHISATPVTPKMAAANLKAQKQAKPVFDDVQFHGFDLWLANQPVMVLTAKARIPGWPDNSAASGEPYSVVLVARTDIYGDLRKLYAGVTDRFHLDVAPQLELIDTVDADGDGLGELLFRKTSDAGSGYVIYRATADKLWKLFDSLNPE